MDTFGTLLTQYMTRSGINDSELARAIGVRRQTIFRWKEGLVGRPRNRDDVMRCAAKLRLSESERDALLVAGGFPPEDVPMATLGETLPPAEISNEPPDTAETVATLPLPLPTRPTPTRSRPWPLPFILTVIVLAAVAYWLTSRALQPAPPPTATADGLPRRAQVPPEPTPTPGCSPVGAGESLVLILPFASYSPGPTFNVAGRIVESLQSALREYEINNIRIEPINAPARAAFEAATIVEKCAADLAIWGEYDSGRVRAHFTMGGDRAGREWERLLTGPDELTPVINVDTPREVRILALLALGRLYRDEGDPEAARRLLEAAYGLDPAEAETRATLAFYLAYLHSNGASPDWNEAITLYDEAIRLQPEWVNARYNRGVAYLRRSYDVAEPTADLDRAIDDLTYAIGVSPRFTLAYINRGIAYYERRSEEDVLAAEADFSRTITLDPASTAAYFNRALLRIRANREGWIEDLEKVLELDATYSAAQAAFCWGYALGDSPELALPHCEQAVAAMPADHSTRDGRAITLARLGRYDEAAADLELYLGWVNSRPPEAYARYRGPQIEAWLTQLRAGSNPFHEALLASLR